MQIYIHVPFCKSKCLYCDFTSFRCKEKADVFDYLNALNCEIDMVFEDLKEKEITTIYIGGGTPTVLDIDEFDCIIQGLSKHVDLTSVAEFTVECNPESLTDEKLEYFKSVGVNRLSIGIQSLNDDNLHVIGRLHDAKRAVESVKIAKKYFDNVSVDFIIGLPHDDFKSVEDEINALAPLVKHVSVYTLQLEENTPLERLVKEEKISLPDDDMTEDLLQKAIEVLVSNGFNRYEISNFARKGYESRHNTGYWKREEYCGLGLGASSCVKAFGEEIRFKNTDNLSEYIDTLSKKKFPRQEIESLTPDEILREKIMLGLRLKEGIDERLLADKSDLIDGVYSSFFRKADGKIAFTDEGMNVSNFILADLIY